MPEHKDLAGLDVRDLRRLIRAGGYTRHTAGLAAGRLQCNLAILPEEYATDFIRFCELNPKPCPIVAIGNPGDPSLPELGQDIDIRTDVPRYRLFRDGVFDEEVTDITDHWRSDFVTVALGCSFTFENALMAHGIAVKHIDLDQTVPMYRSNIGLSSAGPFGGEMVVTMRPIPASRVGQAWEISSRYPQAHGAPIAKGAPQDIGIADLQQPDWGDPVDVEEGEVPVYWACGVTPQNVLMKAKIPFCITHAPGHMLVADVAEDADIPAFNAHQN
ncbi:putative hydro-lyase [uncultured Roseobacter sp.]|uniref:putative hydro-lyase n=1 Tax=uncultured Roseobacter sp. TaxID=114847 RepID=UPI00262E50D2|nr:putative hydro-lyase [uncultured Roseobacter sp.]